MWLNKTRTRCDWIKQEPGVTKTRTRREWNVNLSYMALRRQKDSVFVIRQFSRRLYRAGWEQLCPPPPTKKNNYARANKDTDGIFFLNHWKKYSRGRRDSKHPLPQINPFNARRDIFCRLASSEFIAIPSFLRGFSITYNSVFEREKEN